ncbi:hypothetical protein BD413DRAFT_614212 [Trametes elegans]|nr:hypothetical protein BD413DRAFT_614212 [Trametes elegans]
MDAFDNIPTIPGSRRPICIPAFSDASSASSQTPTPPSSRSNTSSVATRSRRKPAIVYRSPAADDATEWDTQPTARRRGTPPYEKPSSRSLSAETSRTSPPLSIPARRAAAQRKVPLFPLYHPLGPFAQSLPELDPGIFGLPSSLNIEDPDDQRDADAGRRSASRAQRPGQRGRDRETATDDAQSNGTLNGNGVLEPTGRNSSPRKRRGGGAKRKRKDADDGDTAFPPPAKRTRNPRGVNNNAPAAPSPLVSEAVAASDLVEDAAEEEAQEEAPQPPKRSARTRKPRAQAAKRRDSSGSASTTTSASVAIAATAKTVAAPAQSEVAEHEVEPAPEAHVLPSAAAPGEDAPTHEDHDAAGEKKAEDEDVKEPSSAPQERPLEDEPAPALSPQPPQSPQPSQLPPLPQLPSPPRPSQQPQPPQPPLPSEPLQAAPVEEPPAKARKPPAPPSPKRAPTAPPVLPPPPQEEREEGELSDDGPVS